MKKLATLTKSLLLAVALLSPLSAVCDPIQQPVQSVGIHDGGRGRLLFSQDDAPGQYILAPTLKTDVNMTITGMVARVKVSQHFTNPGDDWVNGIYTFPLPELSAVDHMNMRVGERRIEGQIQAKEKARQTFQKAKREGRKAGLVEQQRTNIFTTNVANIGPGETVVVDIEYQQTLQYDMGEFSIRFPMVVAPRYIPGNAVISGFQGSGWANNTDEVPDASEITPGIKAADDPDKQTVNFNISLETGFDLAMLDSDFHPVVVDKLGPQQFHVSLDGAPSLANRDFVLRWRPVAAARPQGAFFTQQKDGETYALLMVMPPLAPVSSEQVLAKEMIFVIDTSGSMHGESMTQARQALLYGLDKLNPGDSFNIVEFNSSSYKLFHQAVPANPSNLQRARNYVLDLSAEGGTNIEEALSVSLADREMNDTVRQVVFITDGSVGNEQFLFDYIKGHLGDSRLFTVGIGSAPNSRFMRGAASLGRGTFTYIGAVDQVTKQMSELFTKLQNPVLRDVVIAGDDGAELGAEVEYWPNPIADLYLGEPLLLSLKLAPDQQNLSLSGKLAGQDWYLDLPIDNGGTEKGLDVLWARNKIRSLSENARDAAERKQNEVAITELGLQYHLVTRYTSLVAVDVTPTKPEGETGHDKALSNHLPHGWTKHRPHGQLPRGATSAQFNLLMGLLLLLSAGFYWRRQRG